MAPGSDLTARLRDRIVSGLHLGQLHTGDRLTSIRELSEEMGINARTVAKAYRALEAEGLVEIRGRSGVYVAEQDRLDGKLLPETVHWMAGVLTEARKRRMKIPEYHEFVRQCTVAVRVRCACVESTRDAMKAYCTELDEDWGFDVDTVLLDPDAQQKGKLPDTGRVLDSLVERLRGADLITTSSFLASVVREAAEALDKPMVMLTTHPDLRAAIRRHLDEGPLTVVAVDPEFGERMRMVYGEATGKAARIRVVLAEDADAVAKLDPEEPVLLTRATHEQLGDMNLSMVFPHSPMLSPECERELAEILIRINRDAWPRGDRQRSS
jgi:DNA-binding transcriptional regulator YhcF (GntR family)